ncbi:MAG: hypothetical protein M1818_000175 [Claussenomyces sp. TS43310]|nr:MAG: hypothetical protein M1818_000175 [Claussenomyces sp. TS43310]
MATTLGKRKRRNEDSTRKVQPYLADSHETIIEDAYAVFRKHFEDRFKPLPTVRKLIKTTEDEPCKDAEVSDWEGISESEGWLLKILDVCIQALTGSDDTKVETIAHTATQPPQLMSKEELKNFMTSKPPSSASVTHSATLSKSRPAFDNDPSEAGNLKKDLALQRLLAESHLLDSSDTRILSGSSRHKAADLRLQNMGAKTSIMTQKSMPMAMRRGIIAKKEQVEEKRRTEARANGIVLEVFKSKGGGTPGNREAKRRDRGVITPGVGRFKGSTLTLSKRDIHEIQGPKKSHGGNGVKARARGRQTLRLARPHG